MSELGHRRSETKNYTESFGILQTHFDSNFFRKPFNNIKDVHWKGLLRAMVSSKRTDASKSEDRGC